MTAAFFLEHTNSLTGDLQLQIIEAVPENWVYETFQGGTHDGQRRIWRTAVRRSPLVMQIVGNWCQVLPSDQPLLTRAFLQNPMMYTHCQSHLRVLDYVAHIAFTHNGLQIRDSHFVDDKQFAQTAFRQNGLALRWVSARLQASLDVVMQAVRQNGLALAWSKVPKQFIRGSDGHSAEPRCGCVHVNRGVRDFPRTVSGEKRQLKTH